MEPISTISSLHVSNLTFMKRQKLILEKSNYRILKKCQISSVEQCAYLMGLTTDHCDPSQKVLGRLQGCRVIDVQEVIAYETVC